MRIVTCKGCQKITLAQDCPIYGKEYYCKACCSWYVVWYDKLRTFWWWLRGIE